MMPLLAGIATKMLTQHMIIELTLSILKWLASRSENALDDEIVKVVERELKRGLNLHCLHSMSHFL